MEDAFWKATPGPHKNGVTLRLPGHAAIARQVRGTSLQVPGLTLADEPVALQAVGGDLLVHVPPEIAQELEPGTAYMMRLPAFHLQGMVEDWPAPANTGPTLPQLIQSFTPAAAQTRPEALTASLDSARGFFTLPDRERRRALTLAIVAVVGLFFILPLLLAWIFWGELFHLSPAPEPPSGTRHAAQHATVPAPDSTSFLRHLSGNGPPPGPHEAESPGEPPQ